MVCLGRKSQMAAEQPPHLAFGDPLGRRHLRHVQSIFELRVEHFEQPFHPGMVGVHALRHVETLWVFRPAHPVVDEFLGHGGGDRPAQVLGR